MIDSIFDWCVNVLVYWANMLGITCKEINVWVFVFLWPVITVSMGIVILRQRQLLRNSSKGNNQKHR